MTRLLTICGHHQRHDRIGGASLIHSELIKRLPAEMGDGWTTEVVPALQPIGRPSLRSRLLSDIPAATDLLLTTSTPLPFGAGKFRLMPIVYDVSWYWSDGKAYRLYRHADLLRTARRASEILTISGSSQAQIEALTRHQVPICPMPLGPGQFEGFEAAPAKDTQTILLMGRAAHKANELAAELLVQSSLVQREFRVVAVWVSSATERILRKGMSPSQIQIHGALSASRLAEVFTQADRYVALGNSEGFGFPYVEAAYFGCDVIAPRIALTSEVLGEEGNYLSSSHPTVHELEGAVLAWDENRVGRMQRVSAQRTWKHTALTVAQRIRAHFGESH